MLDYRKYIDSKIKISKKLNNKFNYSYFAKQAQVQTTYLSKVLREEAHLNSDQIFLLAEALELKDNEKEYLNLLHEHNRSILNKRKALISNRIKQLEKEFEKLEGHLTATFVAPEKNIDLAKYYLNPLNTLVHICLTIPAYNQNPNRIADALRIKNDELESILHLLVDLKIIEPAKNNKDGKFEILQHSLQLSKESIYTNPHHTLMRYKCQDRIVNLPDDKKKNFSVTFSADPETQKNIYKEFLKFIVKIEEVASTANPEEVYQLNFDFFSWTEN